MTRFRKNRSRSSNKSSRNKPRTPPRTPQKKTPNALDTNTDEDADSLTSTSSNSSRTDLTPSVASDDSWDSNRVVPRSYRYHATTVLYTLTIFLPLLILNLILLIPFVIAARVNSGMWDWMPRRCQVFWKATYRVHGLRGIVTMQIGIQTFIVINNIFMALDYLVFPSFRRTRVKSPIFVTGIMRSGTTFLHRQLTQTGEYCTWQLWEILFPSLTLRLLIKPLIFVIDWCIKKWATITGSGGYDEFQAYDVGLMSGAHEEALLSHVVCAGDFWIEFTSLGFVREYQSQWLGLSPDPDDSSKTHGVKRKEFWKRMHLAHLMSCLKRQVYWTGKTQVIAKSPSLTWCLTDVLEYIPDAKILLLVRHPKETLTSTLSLFDDAHKVLVDESTLRLHRSDIYGNALWRRHEQWTRILDCLAKMQSKANLSAAASNRVCVIRYEDLQSDLKTTFMRCMEHCDLTASLRLKRAVETQVGKQKRRRRKHVVRDLTEFEVDVEYARILFSDVCAQFGFDWPLETVVE